MEHEAARQDMAAQRLLLRERSHVNVHEASCRIFQVPCSEFGIKFLPQNTSASPKYEPGTLQGEERERSSITSEKIPRKVGCGAC